MGEAIWVDVTDSLWLDLLTASAAHDVYHTPVYHRLAALNGEGEPRLFAWREGEAFVALPLLLRPLADVPGLEDETGCDATSVYGYPGPIVSRTPVDSDLRACFRSALRDTLMAQGVVSVFSRMHPLLEEQTDVLDGLGELRDYGATVSIDLTLPEDEQFRRYRRDHRAGVRKLANAGYTCRVDEDLSLIWKFVELYHDNMRRLGASSYYFFRKNYFDFIVKNIPHNMNLIVCERFGEVACASLFFEMNGIVQYHLSATAEEHLRSAPAKLLLDFARRSYSAREARVLHLGGGLGSREDGLLLFKAGFSDRRHTFRTWRWIVDRERYEALCAKRADGRDGVPDRPDFFPRYRA